MQDTENLIWEMRQAYFQWKFRCFRRLYGIPLLRNNINFNGNPNHLIKGQKILKSLASGRIPINTPSSFPVKSSKVDLVDKSLVYLL